MSRHLYFTTIYLKKKKNLRMVRIVYLGAIFHQKLVSIFELILTKAMKNIFLFFYFMIETHLLFNYLQFFQFQHNNGERLLVIL